MNRYGKADLRRQLAVNIDNAILDSGMDMKDIAEKAGIHRNTLGQWASGKFTPTAIGLLLLSRALGIGIDDLLKDM